MEPEDSDDESETGKHDRLTKRSREMKPAFSHDPNEILILQLFFVPPPLDRDSPTGSKQVREHIIPWPRKVLYECRQKYIALLPIDTNLLCYRCCVLCVCV